MVFFLKSGYATISGVITALCIPSDLIVERKIESKLHPFVAFFILPVFAFTNSGFPMSAITINDFLSPMCLGIIIGLFIGKQIGVYGACAVALRTKYFKLPTTFNKSDLYGVSLLCGVGFTMSLFIGTLAFDGLQEMVQDKLSNLLRLGVVSGSLLSAIFGYTWLRYSNRNYRYE